MRLFNVYTNFIDLQDPTTDEQSNFVRESTEAINFMSTAIQSDSDVQDVVFEEPEVHPRGRPKNSKKTKPSGAPLLPSLCDFKKKDLNAKAKLILHLLFKNPNTVANIKEHSFDIRLMEFKNVIKENLPDTFLDRSFTEQVTIELVEYLQRFWKSEKEKITTYLKEFIAKKQKMNALNKSGICVCPTCKEPAKLGTAQCNSCLSWYHLKNCVPKQKMLLPKESKKSWYCDTCIAISKL